MWQLILRYDINEGSAQGQQQRRAIASAQHHRRAGRARLVHVSVTPQSQRGLGEGEAAPLGRRRRRSAGRLRRVGQQPRPSVTSFSDLTDGRVFGLPHQRTAAVTRWTCPPSPPPPLAAANLRFIFDKAEEALGIPSVLSPRGVGRLAQTSVDSQSLMTYLSFFKAWRPQLLQRKSIKLTLGDVEGRKAAAAGGGRGHLGPYRAPPATPHRASVSGKTLDTATQLELNEARQHHHRTAEHADRHAESSSTAKRRRRRRRSSRHSPPLRTLTQRTSTGSSQLTVASDVTEPA